MGWRDPGGLQEGGGGTKLGRMALCQEQRASHFNGSLFMPKLPGDQVGALWGSTLEGAFAEGEVRPVPTKVQRR